ncbi:MAG TPA: DUF4389 domain-containing protein [Acidimicrobiales bacterium]|nr:DUF4389 domain-containing protein [Acidimicrobiales bacterium]
MTTSMPPPPPAAPVPSGSPPPSPVHVDLDSPLEIPNLRAILNPIMAIPHFVVLWVFSIGLSIVTFIAWFSILFTGEYPPAMFDFATGVLRYQWRVNSYYMFMREPYPSFTLTSGPNDPGDDPAKWSIDVPTQPRDKMTVLLRALLVIPAMVVLFLYGIVAYVMLVIAWFTVLFTGKWSQSSRDYIIRVMRYGYRVLSYYYLMTDLYPGFAVE